jgi:uncharacterized protein (TIGR00255 family)
MTAFGRGEYMLGDKVFIVEIRSVNNRYRDIVLRIPKNLQILEDEIRSQIFTKIRRGRLEVSIHGGKNGEGAGYELELNLPLVRSYLKIISQLSDEFSLDKNLSAEYISQLKDVILIKSEEIDIDESRSGLLEALSRALDSLDVMRIQEGGAIEKDFRKRLDLIAQYLDEIEERTPLVVEEYRKRLKDRLKSLEQNIAVDEARLAQEVAIFADRSDITEEIVRSRSHLKQFRNYMSMDDSIGRRLEFLIQEIHREFNTMGAKASDSSISARVVEVRAELEKLREQVQNVE